VYGALAADPGVVTGIAGVDEALSMPGAERVWLFVSPGARVASPSDSTGVPGYVLAAGADRDEARARMRAARALIRITTRG
jgi:cysteine synthase A